LGAIRAIDLVGEDGGAVHDVGEGGNDAAQGIGQENVGVLAGVGGQFADEATGQRVVVRAALESACTITMKPIFSKLQVICTFQAIVLHDTGLHLQDRFH
jgi:hypothetical protein